MKKLIYSWIPKALAVAMVLTAVGVQSQVAYAASLTSMSDTMSRLKENTASNHDIRFVTPSGVQAGETVIVTFSSDFDLSVGPVAFGDIDFEEGDSSNCATANYTPETLAAAPSGATWGAVVAGDVLTFTSGTGTVATNVCIRIKIGTNATGGVNQIVNGPSDDDDTIIFTGTFADTGTIAVDIITDDQVVITATVGPSLSFALSDTTIGFGALGIAAAKFANGAETGSASDVTAHTLAASTNATSGYVITMFGPTLTSGANTITAIGGANTSSTPGTEQFGVRFDETGAGSGTVTAPYAAAGFAYDASAAPDQIASASGATDTSTYDAHYVANIDINTDAGAYATTLTYTATATY
jgi:hypothetical protein